MEFIVFRIRELMAEQNISQKRLAALLQVSYSSLSNYLSGRRWLSLNLILELCRCLHTSSDYLLGLSEQKNPFCLPDDEQALLELYRSLPSPAKHFMIQQTRQLAQLCRRFSELQ